MKNVCYRWDNISLPFWLPLHSAGPRWTCWWPSLPDPFLKSYSPATYLPVCTCVWYCSIPGAVTGIFLVKLHVIDDCPMNISIDFQAHSYSILGTRRILEFTFNLLLCLVLCSYNSISEVVSFSGQVYSLWLYLIGLLSKPKSFSECNCSSRVGQWNKPETRKKVSF